MKWYRPEHFWVLLVIAVILLVWLIASLAGASSEFGVLISCLTLVVVTWNLVTQRRDITHERKRENFFHLLSAWQTAMANSSYRDSVGSYLLGMHGFLEAENVLLGSYTGTGFAAEEKYSRFFREARADANGSLPRDRVHEIYTRFYEQCVGGSLVYIFRIQYQILKTLDTTELPQNMRNELAEIYRSMLSDPELHLLLYFALSSYAPKDYPALACKYRLLDNLLYKEERFIADRIPEIEHFEKYSDWRKRRKELIEGSISP